MVAKGAPNRPPARAFEVVEWDEFQELYVTGAIELYRSDHDGGGRIWVRKAGSRDRGGRKLNLEEFCAELNSHVTDRGGPALVLKWLGVDHTYIILAWSPEGRAWQRRIRAWRRLEKQFLQRRIREDPDSPLWERMASSAGYSYR